jgi:hypothetical protein
MAELGKFSSLSALPEPATFLNQFNPNPVLAAFYPRIIVSDVRYVCLGFLRSYPTRIQYELSRVLSTCVLRRSYLGFIILTILGDLYRLRYFLLVILL